jgi:hypothetical protein
MHIEITREAYLYIRNQTEKGYDRPYKQEKIGFLFGEKNNDVIVITKVVAYKGGIKKRSHIDFYSDSFGKRAKTLASKLGKTWLGSYHTHVEEDDEMFLGLSDEDKEIYIEDNILVGITVSVWATDDTRKPPMGAKRITDIKRFWDSNYRFIMSGYVIDKRGPRLVRLVIV